MIFGRPKWNKCDKIKCTLYSFYNNFLEILQSLFWITKLEYFLHSSSFSYLFISSYILEGTTLTICVRNRQAWWFHIFVTKFSKCAFSPIKTSITIYFSIVNTTFTNLCNTSKSYFKFHATNSGNLWIFFLCFSKSFRPTLKNNWFHFCREYLEFRRNVEISLKFAIKAKSIVFNVGLNDFGKHKKCSQNYLSSWHVI